MDLQTTILSRRSVRKFKDTPVPVEVIEEMLEMARRSPSGGNGQEHVFGVVRDGARKRALAEAAGNQMWIADAPVVFACCARLETAPSARPVDDFGLTVNRLRWGAPFWQYLQDYPDWRSAATLLANATPMIPSEHIMLTAVAHGLSACMVGWLDVARVSEILRLPPDQKCLFLLPVGYADETPSPKRLKSIEEISFWETYES